MPDPAWKPWKIVELEDMLSQMNEAPTILIAGAGSDVGRGLTEHFAGRGHRVIATDKSAAAATANSANGDVLG